MVWRVAADIGPDGTLNVHEFLSVCFFIVILVSELIRTTCECI